MVKVDFICSIIGASINFCVGCIIFLKNRKHLLYKTFSFLVWSIFVWNFFQSLEYKIRLTGMEITLIHPKTWLFQRLNSIGVACMPTACLHFVMTLIEMKKKKVLLLSYFATFFLLGSLLTPWAISHSWGYVLLSLHLPIYGYSLYLLWYGANRTTSTLERIRLRYMFGIGVFGIVGGYLEVLPIFGIPSPSISNLIVSIWILLMVYIILKYRMFDIGEIGNTFVSLSIIGVLLFGFL